MQLNKKHPIIMAGYYSAPTCMPVTLFSYGSYRGLPDLICLSPIHHCIEFSNIHSDDKSNECRCL